MNAPNGNPHTRHLAQQFELHTRLFDNALDGLDDARTLRRASDAVSGAILASLAALPDAALDGPSPVETPISDTFGGFLAFLLHHEAYHLGQLGILRKYLGKDALRYA